MATLRDSFKEHLKKVVTRGSTQIQKYNADGMLVWVSSSNVGDVNTAITRIRHEIKVRAF